MRLPAAFAPLRHPIYRALWLANGAAGLGGWMQSTGAAWMMATLAPDPLMVSLVQAATLLPVFLFALPAGALADIVDRRLFLIAAQVFMMISAALLAVLTALGLTGPWLLLLFTFLVGAGAAAGMPAWAATVPETVPREDLVPALALNAIGYNLTRAVGPALAGLLLGMTNPSVAFALNAVSFLGVVIVLALWRREHPQTSLPKEHLLSAIRAGMRFVAATPPMRAAIVRAIA
jgi:MFS family permease